MVQGWVQGARLLQTVLRSLQHQAPESDLVRCGGGVRRGVGGSVVAALHAALQGERAQVG